MPSRLRSLSGAILVGVSIVLAIIAVTAASPRAQATAPACPGRNLLDGLATSDPSAHASIRAAAEATENAKAIFWRIDNGDKPASYLLGTMHVTDDRVHALSPAVVAALGKSRRLVLEVDDFSPVRAARAMQKSRSLLVLPDGKSLAGMLSADELGKLEPYFSQAGVKDDAAQTLRPWVILLLMTAPDCERQRAAGGLKALDVRLAMDAEKRGIGVLGLETVESQLAALAGVPEDDQLALLKATIAMLPARDDVHETTIQLYLRRDLGAIWPLQMALAGRHGVGPATFAALADSLLTRRNIKMRDRAVGHLGAGGVFIAVGALHLPGKTGLVALLRDLGYALTPLE